MRGNNNLKKRKVHPEESKELTAPQDDVDALFSDIEREFVQLLNVDHISDFSAKDNGSKDRKRSKGKITPPRASGDSDSDQEGSELVELGYGNVSKSDVMAIQELKNQFHRLEEQMKAMKAKYNSVVASCHQQEIKNKELSVQVETLEEENSELQKALTQRGENGSAPTTVSRRSGRRIAPVKKPKDDALRAGLLEDDDEDDIGDDMDMFGQNKRDILLKLLNWFVKKTPFQNDIREMHATFGGAVAAYFLFFRWMFMNFIFIAVLAIVYTFLHVSSIIYRESMTSLFQGDNLLPRYMLLSSYAEGEQVTYTTLLLVGLLGLGGIALQKLVREDKYTKQMSVIEETNSYTFSKEVFCSWDNSLVDAVEAHDLSGLMTQQFREKLAESKRIGLKRTRTNMQVFELYCRRALGFTLHASMQFAAYTTIVYLTVQSQSISRQLVAAGLPGTFSNIIVPGTVTAINSGTPMLLKYVTRMEKWDSGQVELNILLFRMYLSNMLNLLILAFSYALLADPMLFAENDNYHLRQRVEREFDESGYTCRLNQAADGMFTLVLTEFVLNPIIFFGAGYGNVVLSWCTKKWVKVEFDIAQRMVAMLYFVALMFLSYPFAPLTVVLMPLMLAIRLKLEKKVAARLYSRPRTIWVAHKSGITFTIFYLLSLLFIALPSAAYFLTRKTFPKDCDIQDEYIGLCASAVDGSSNSCTLDTSSDFYDLYSDTSYCKDGYPACICNFACGPYVSEINSYESFKHYIYSIAAVKYLYEYLIQYSCGAWLLVTLCYILARMRRNTIKVAADSFGDKERGLLSHIEILENEKKKNEKLIQRLKLIDTAGVNS